MKFLLTNDDGIDAPGLAALAEAASSLGQTITLAPDRHLSGCAHQTTTDRGLTLTHRGGQRHCLDGTPADCVRVGLSHLATDVDWILSGINEGGNLGADLYHSGTVAAAREATLMGKPAIALSQYRRRRQSPDWARAARWAVEVIRTLIEGGAAPGVFWNVNLPDAEAQVDPPQVVYCQMDPHPLPVHYRLVDGLFHYAGNYHSRERRAGHDIDVCFAGAIAVTRVSLLPCEEGA